MFVGVESASVNRTLIETAWNHLTSSFSWQGVQQQTAAANFTGLFFSPQSNHCKQTPANQFGGDVVVVRVSIHADVCIHIHEKKWLVQASTEGIFGLNSGLDDSWSQSNEQTMVLRSHSHRRWRKKFNAFFALPFHITSWCVCVCRNEKLDLLLFVWQKVE